MRNKKRLILALGILVSTANGFAATPEAYRIGPDDVLTVSFWQQPDLNQTVQVRQDGKVALPVIGEMEIAGLTAEEAADRIVDRISRYNRNISQALVQVVGFNARKLFVSGQVGTPGKYAFEVVPDVWNAIRNAGGPTESADLRRVAVVSPSGNVEVVDLAEILAAGKADTLKPLLAGTTVDVPRRMDFLPSETYNFQLTELRPIVYVTGAVLSPGPKPIEGDLYIYDALALAGGVGPEANLKKVKVITKAPNGPVTQTLDLRGGTNDRTSLNYKIRYEDMVIVERRGSGFWGPVRDIAAFAGVISSIILIADRVNR
jgi:polysaccharide export outer membrane protein